MDKQQVNPIGVEVCQRLLDTFHNVIEAVVIERNLLSRIFCGYQLDPTLGNDFYLVSQRRFITKGLSKYGLTRVVAIDICMIKGGDPHLDDRL